jgi:CRP/FNR family transcriptional regulator, cyclic AMP receptor protein
MSIECDTTSLKNLPIFNGLDAKRLKLVAMMAERLHYTPGQKIANQGDLPNTIFIILSGEIELSRTMPCGEMHALSLGTGSLFGDVPMLCDKSYLGNVTATTDVVVLGVGKDLFFELLQSVPEFAVALCRDLASRLYQLVSRTIDPKSQN